MEMISLCGVLVITAFLAVLLRPHRPELTLALGVAAGVGVALAVLSSIKEPLAALEQLFSKAGIAGETIQLMLKSFGICLLTQLAADVCRDAGETALASRAELAGKAALLVLALPLFGQIVDLSLFLMNGGTGA